MNTEPGGPECPEDDLAAAQARIRQLEDRLCEAEQELKAANDIIDEQDFNIECLRLQLEAADLMLDEAAAARRKLERQIADLEDAEPDEPCSLVIPVPGAADQRQPMRFSPVLPRTLKATQDDLASLEALVGRLGWEEMMYHLGVIIGRQAVEAAEADRPNKKSLEVAADMVCLWGPSFHWCDEAVCRELRERLNSGSR
jgi:uncharacterized coiled-coil protein SlyX